MRKRLGRAVLAGTLLMCLPHRAALAQASAAIQATVRVVDPSSSAYPAATIRLALDPRISTRHPLRRNLRGATLLVEIPAGSTTATARRVTVIHW